MDEETEYTGEEYFRCKTCGKLAYDGNLGEHGGHTLTDQFQFTTWEKVLIFLHLI